MNEHDRAFLWPVVVRSFLAAILFLAVTRIGVAAQDTALQLDPQHTTINFTLGDVLHTVHGTFQLKQGALRLSAPSGKLTGKIAKERERLDRAPFLGKPIPHQRLLCPTLALGETVEAIGERADQLANIAAEPGKNVCRLFLTALGGNESMGEGLCR